MSNKKGVVGNNGRNMPRMPRARERVPILIYKAFMPQKYSFFVYGKTTGNLNEERTAKSILCRQAEFASLYGVPQHIVILEIKPQLFRFDIQVHSPKEETSKAARCSGAIAAINGSYFNVKEGTSICYLLKDGQVIDTTANDVLSTVTNGAVKIGKGMAS